MQEEKLLSTGDAARELGVSRDALLWALRTGAPEPAKRVAGRRVFEAEDLDQLRLWLENRGRKPVKDAAR